MNLRKLAGPMLSITLLAGCAGTQRSCSSWSAGTFGADWVVAQVGFDGKPAHCWILRNTSVANEDKSDGIHWLGRDGDLVHLAGWVDRVQVGNGDFARAARELGINDTSTCTSY